MDEIFFDMPEETRSDRVFVLVIYDIADDKKRTRFAKCMQGYGNRVQRSAFEASLTHKKYQKLIREIPTYVSAEDSVRVYRINGRTQVSVWGKESDTEEEDIILI